MSSKNRSGELQVLKSALECGVYIIKQEKITLPGASLAQRDTLWGLFECV